MALLQLVLLSIVFAGPSLAAIANRTIDDTRGDAVTGNPVIYQGLWNSNVCPQCLIQPDPARAVDGTWTETTYFQQSQDPINATLTFTGTAIYVYFILANNAGAGVISKTMANITLDNQSPLLFEHIPDMSTTALQYYALGFSQDNLENVHHSLVISVSGIQEEVYVNFDYAIYTHEDIVAEGTGEPLMGPTDQPPIPTASQPESPQPFSNSFPSIMSATEVFSVPLTAQLPSNAPSISAPLSTSPGPLVLPVPAPGLSTFLTPPSSPTDIGTPAGSSQTPSSTPFSQHAKSNIPVGAIAGGGVGGLLILSLFVFGIVFTRRWRRQKHRYSNRGSANLLGSEGGSTESRIYAGNVENDGIDTTVVPFPLGSPSPEQFAGVKPSEAVAMSSRDDMPSLTLAPRTTRNLTDSEVARANSGRRMADLRRVRQEELDQRLQGMQQEMIEVLNEINNRRASHQMLRPLPIPGQQSQTLSMGVRINHGGGPTQDQTSVDELQETVHHMRRHIEHLQQQQQSAWAQGLSDDPPPGYTTDTRL